MNLKAVRGRAFPVLEGDDQRFSQISHFWYVRRPYIRQSTGLPKLVKALTTAFGYCRRAQELASSSSNAVKVHANSEYNNPFAATILQHIGEMNALRLSSRFAPRVLGAARNVTRPSVFSSKFLNVKSQLHL